MTRTTSAVVVAALLAAGYFAACGGSGDNDPSDTATFFGDVSSVTGSSASLGRRTTLASRLFSFPSVAWAQTSCAAPGGGRLLFCVDELFCTTVDPDLCDFRAVATVEDGGPVGAVLRFVDDVNEDGEFDDTEDDSVVTQSLQFCTGDQVEIANAVVNFTSGTATATVRKTFDNCDPEPTPTPTKTVSTPVATNTPGTPSPTATATATATTTPSL